VDACKPPGVGDIGVHAQRGAGGRGAHPQEAHGGAVRVDPFKPKLKLSGTKRFKLTFDMTKCVKPLRHLATSSTQSSKWSVLIGRAGAKSD